MIHIERVPSDTGYIFTVTDGDRSVECSIGSNDTLASGDGRHVIAAGFEKLAEGLACLEEIAPGAHVKLGEFQAEKRRHQLADVPIETHPEIVETVIA